MMVTIKNPPHEEVMKLGELAYVTKEQRKAILDAPFGEFNFKCGILRREIKELKKKKEIK